MRRTPNRNDRHNLLQSELRGDGQDSCSKDWPKMLAVAAHHVEDDKIRRQEEGKTKGLTKLK